MISEAQKEYEVTVDFESVENTQYYIDGEKVLGYGSLVLNYLDWDALYEPECPYRTYEPKGYDPETNSINIAVGNVYHFSNGYKIHILQNRIWVEGYGREGHYDSDRKMELFAWGLGDFLHFVDRNTYPGLIAEDSLPMVLSFLDELGVDTEKEFTVNGTHCRMTEGKLQEAGSAHGGIPEDFYEKAVQRYTEYMKTSVYEIRDHKYVQMSLKA